MSNTPVVTVFLRHRGDVLLLKRSEDVGSYAGRWGGVAGHIEGQAPEKAARKEIEEETGLDAAAPTLVRRGASFEVDDAERETTWEVHPFLFDAPHRQVETNWETEAAEWVAPTAILRRDVVPDLWTSYRHVAPSILSIADDTTRGSAALSIDALEVLRDRAGSLAVAESTALEDAREKLVEEAERLLAARPSMAAVQNRLHRVMHGTQPDFEPRAVEGAAHTAIARAADADEDAADRATDRVAGHRVLTLSRSGTVLTALRQALQADPDTTVLVAESRPAREGIDVAEALATDGDEEPRITVCTDAAVPGLLAEGDVDVVLVGADTVRPSGAVVNKSGTRGAALAAAREEIPFYVACAVDKIAPEEETRGEEGDRRAVYDGTADVHVRNPTFDVTPADLVTGGVITERRTYAAEDVAAVADDHAGWRSWREAV